MIPRSCRLLACALLLASAVCVARAAGDEDASRRWHEWRRSRTRFPIAAWSYFGRYQGTKAEYQVYADANLTFVSAPVSQYDNALAAGLDVLLGGWEKLYEKPDLLRERTRLSNESKGNVIGYQLMDEPEPDSFKALGDAVRTIYALDKTAAIPIIDMLPNWAWERTSGRTRKYGYQYDGFIEAFIRTVRPPVLLNCHYPTLENGSDRVEYYANLETFRDHALRNDIGLMAFVLCTDQARWYRRPSDSDLRWMVYSSLAYGAQGIWYWNWRIKPDDKYGFREGLVLDGTGEPTGNYHRVKAVNAEILANGNVLMKLRSRNVYHTGTTVPPGTRRYPGPGDTGACAVARFVGDDFIIGEFRNQDDADDTAAYVMIVNKRHGMDKDSSDPLLRATAIFKPSRVYTSVCRCDAVDGKQHPLESINHEGEAGYYSVSLGGGQGILLRLSRK